jgi:carotenoid cleavage dioxygenase-like enzyme
VLLASDALAKSKRGGRNRYLEGVYAPVKKQLYCAELPCEGRIPEDLDGAYLRNGEPAVVVQST